MIISLFFFRRVEKAYDAYQKQEAKLSTTLQENLSGVRVVKAFARQSTRTRSSRRRTGASINAGKYLLLMHATFWPVTDIMCGIADAVRLHCWRPIMAINGEITVGTYLAYSEPGRSGSSGRCATWAA